MSKWRGSTEWAFLSWITIIPVLSLQYIAESSLKQIGTVLTHSPKTAKCRLNCSDGIFKTVLRLNANTCRNRRLRVMCRQKRSSKLPAAAATGCHAQLRLQITHCGRTCGNSFFDLMVGNGIADTDKHFILRMFSNYHTDSGFYYRM